MPVSRSGHHHTLFFFQKSLRNLFWAAFLRQNGLSLVSIFTLMYVYKVGTVTPFFPFFSLSSVQMGLITLVVYVLVLRITVLVGVFPLARLAALFGLPTAAIIGNFLMAARYGLLALSILNPWLIFIAAALQGLDLASFGPAYDTMFAHKASVTKVGRDVGAFTFILQLSHALLPALAGILIFAYGFAAAFVGAMMLLLLSNIPLLSIRWHEKLKAPSVQAFFNWYWHEAEMKVVLAVSGKYISDVVLELWPIYLVLLFGQVERVGLLMSLALFASLIVTYFSGWYIDHTKRNMPFVIGGVLISLFWLGRIGILALQLILILEVAQKVVESFFNPSFDATLYRIAKRLDTYSFYVYKEVVLTVVSIIFWFCLAVVFLLVGDVWNWLFILGALGTLLSTLLYTTSHYD